MALGRRKKERQQEMWIETAALPRSEGHVFYRKLNQLLAEAGFDKFVESLCEEHYHHTMGRPGIPPGRYFRMLLVGYFEGIQCQNVGMVLTNALARPHGYIPLHLLWGALGTIEEDVTAVG